jgi:hypothetical protein
VKHFLSAAEEISLAPRAVSHCKYLLLLHLGNCIDGYEDQGVSVLTKTDVSMC